MCLNVNILIYKKNSCFVKMAKRNKNSILNRIFKSVHTSLVADVFNLHAFLTQQEKNVHGSCHFDIFIKLELQRTCKNWHCWRHVSNKKHNVLYKGRSERKLYYWIVKSKQAFNHMSYFVCTVNSFNRNLCHIHSNAVEIFITIRIPSTKYR